VIVRKVRCAGASRVDQRRRNFEVTIRKAGILIDYRAVDFPNLVIATDISILNCETLTVAQQQQEDINVSAVFRQVTDIDLSRADLRRVIPKQESITGISARCRRIRLIIEKVCR
jgi:hypothetical protein